MDDSSKDKAMQSIDKAMQSIDIGIELSALQGLYTVIMAFGFRHLVEALYKSFSPFPVVGMEVVNETRLFPVLIMMLVGFRFFWGATNIRRFINKSSEMLDKVVVPEKPYFQRKMVKKVRVFIQQSVENGF
jgi:hypothetical protein